jgi:hypothetical protein
MVLFTDPRQVTNWLDPLEKNYTEQRKQRELHHSQSKTVWAQEEAATFTAGDFDQVLKGLSSLSKTAKQISTDREERKYTDFVKGYEQLKFSDQEKIEQIASETDLSLNDASLLKTLSKSGKISPEALIYLEQQSGSKALRLKRLLGWQTVEKSIATLDSEIEQNLYGIRDNFNEAERTGKIDIFYRNALTDKLRKLGLNDRFIATHYEAEINKFSNTKGLSSRLDYKTVEFSKDAAERIATFEKLKYSTDPTTAATIFGTYLQKQIDIDPENGRSKAITFMHRLMKDGKINGSVIQAIKKGAYKSDVGETGKELISDSDWRYIEQGEQEYLTQVKTDHDAKYAALGLQYEAGIIDKTINQEQLESFLLEADSNGQSGTDWYKKLSKYNSNAYNEKIAADLDKDFQKQWNSGELTIETIESSNNLILENKWKPLVELRKKWDKENKWTDQEGVLEGEVNQYTRKRSLDIGEKQTKDELNATNLIIKKANELKAAKLLQVAQTGVPNPNILLEIQDEIDAWKKREGWGEENGPGLFSYVRKNGNATLPNLSNNLKRLNTVGYNYNLNNPNMKSSYNSRLRDFPENTTKEIRHQTPDGIYSKDLLLGYSQNGYFNEEMKYIASEEGLLPGEAYKLAIQALEKGEKDDKEFLVRYNFKRGEEEPAPDVQISNMLTQRLEAIAAQPATNLNEAAVIKNIQHIMRWYGPDYLTPKQRQTIHTILQKVSPVTEGLDPIQAKTQQLRAEGKSDKEIKEWWQLYHDTKLKERVEGGALDLQNIPIG